MADSLYNRLGGYDAVTAVAENLLPRLMGDPTLGRFWKNRGTDGLLREKQLLIDFLCQSTGGSVYYTGRSMTLAHRGMGITDSDWSIFLGHIEDTLAEFNLPENEHGEVTAFIQGMRDEIVDPT